MTHADPPPRRGRLGLVAGLLAAAGAAGLAGGYGLAIRGPDWARPRAESAPPPPPVPSVGDTAVEARLDEIASRLDTRPAIPGPAEPLIVDHVATQALDERLRQVERRQDETLQAAAAALAVAGLEQAAQRSGSFTAAMAAARPALPPSAAVDRLSALAAQGAPSRAALGATFPEAARRAAAAWPSGPGEARWSARLARALQTVVTIRKVDSADGHGLDATLVRAERRIGDGDVTGALAEIRSLPPPAQQTMASWTARAQRRAEVDRALADVRAWALQRVVTQTATEPAR